MTTTLDDWAGQCWLAGIPEHEAEKHMTLQNARQEQVLERILAETRLAYRKREIVLNMMGQETACLRRDEIKRRRRGG